VRIGDIDVARIGLETNRHLSLWWTSCREAERADGHLTSSAAALIT
jgi:hypothetical protein